MKLFLTFAAALGLSATAYAAALSDDFHRSDTNTPDGGWGAHWKVDGAPVFLQGNIGKKQSDGQTVAINTKTSVSDSPFALSAEVYAQANDRWIGLVIYYTSPGNYGVWRVKFTENSANEPTIWQLIEVKNDKSSILQQGIIQPGAEIADPAPLKAWRRLGIERTDDGTYTASLHDPTASDQPQWSTTLKWKDSDQGQTGLMLSNGFVWVKDFSLSLSK